MRTSSKTVCFARPFTLPGIDGVQPAGSYIVQTDEELLPTVLHSASRRLATWLLVTSPSLGPGAAEFARIDPVELEAALARDASGDWSPATEARVDQFLSGLVMSHAVRSAGLSLREFKDLLRGLAARLARRAEASSAITDSKETR